MSPNDVLEPSWLAEYKQKIDAIGKQLLTLHDTIFVLEKIFAFRFDLFMPIPGPFWKLVENALLENCILIIWRVGVDNVYREGLTLQQLKNQIFQCLSNEDYHTQLKDEFKSGYFDGKISNLESKISEIRHNYIAHYNLAKHVNPTPEQIKKRTLFFSELKQYQNTLKEYFDLLCFGAQKLPLHPDYHPDVIHPAGVENRSDIERLLDNVARESDLLNLPEINSYHWEAFRQNLSDESIRILNDYRAKFGLPQL